MFIQPRYSVDVSTTLVCGYTTNLEKIFSRDDSLTDHITVNACICICVPTLLHSKIKQVFV